MLAIIKGSLMKKKGKACRCGLILALVALAVVGALTALGGGLTSIFDRINTQLDNAVTTSPSS